MDNDRDTWVDGQDPDCESGDEDGGRGDTICNDGMDNDGDGLEDGQDPGCEDAYDGDESS